MQGWWCALGTRRSEQPNRRIKFIDLTGPMAGPGRRELALSSYRTAYRCCIRTPREVSYIMGCSAANSRGLAHPPRPRQQTGSTEGRLYFEKLGQAVVASLGFKPTPA
jgi:hypothetical protein